MNLISGLSKLKRALKLRRQGKEILRDLENPKLRVSKDPISILLVNPSSPNKIGYVFFILADKKYTNNIDAPQALWDKVYVASAKGQEKLSPKSLVQQSFYLGL